MTQKQALGRGLSALLPGRDEVPRETGAREVEIGHLVPNRFQPRRKKELKPRSLYFAAARMWPSSNSCRASSRSICQLSDSGFNSGKSLTSTYGRFGTAENMYINTLYGAMNVE